MSQPTPAQRAAEEIRELVLCPRTVVYKGTLTSGAVAIEKIIETHMQEPISVSPALLQSREEQRSTSMAPPSGARMSWDEQEPQPAGQSVEDCEKAWADWRTKRNFPSWPTQHEVDYQDAFKFAWRACATSQQQAREEERSEICGHLVSYCGPEWKVPAPEHQRSSITHAINHLGGITKDYASVAQHTESLRAAVKTLRGVLEDAAQVIDLLGGNDKEARAALESTKEFA